MNPDKFFMSMWLLMGVVGVLGMFAFVLLSAAELLKQKQRKDKRRAKKKPDDAIPTAEAVD
jgi:hypothetical protein